MTESIPSVLYGVCMYISGVVHRLGGQGVLKELQEIQNLYQCVL